MKSREFYYQLSRPTYNEFVSALKRLKQKYCQSLYFYKKINNELLQKYNKETQIKLMKEYKKLIIKIILDVLKLFPQLEKLPHTTFMHGSFAKSINRFESDIDLNILYSNIYKSLMLPLEELISLALTDIIGLAGRDKVHTMMIYTPIKHYEDLNIYDTTCCSVIFPSGERINYSCRPGYNQVMMKTLNSSREFKDFVYHLMNHSNSMECQEWCYSFEELENNCRYYDIYKIIRKNDQKTNSTGNFIGDYNQLVENLMLEISNYKFILENNISISEINLNLKVKNLSYIYRSLSLIRRFLIHYGVKLKNIDFFELCTNLFLREKIGIKNIDNYQNSVLKYLWQVSRIEDMLKKYGYNFSSRSIEKIFKSELMQMFLKEYNCKDFASEQTIIIKKMHNSILMCLKNIKL